MSNPKQAKLETSPVLPSSEAAAAYYLTDGTWAMYSDPEPDWTPHIRRPMEGSPSLRGHPPSPSGGRLATTTMTVTSRSGGSVFTLRQKFPSPSTSPNIVLLPEQFPPLPPSSSSIASPLYPKSLITNFSQVLNYWYKHRQVSTWMLSSFLRDPVCPTDSNV